MELDNIIQNNLQRLNESAELRKRNIVGVHLNACMERVADMSTELSIIIEETKSEAGMMRKICERVSQAIETAAEGCITATEYVQKSMAKQQVYVFVGTHWMPCKMQVFYDFVKDVCYKVGLPESIVEAPDRMCKMFEQVAFRVARDRECVVPHDGVWINMQNGTLEIDSDGTTRLREHNKADFFTYVLPYAYTPSAFCPAWHAFLDQVMPETEMQQLFGEYIGYCFTQGLKLEKMAILYGSGANGKSVATDVVAELLGRMNVSHVDLEKLTTDENHRFQIEGKLANISQENGVNVQYSTLKNLVSGEPVMVKTLYKDARLMTNYGKLIASYNTLPKTENTYGFFRRWLLFPFNVTISEAKRDVRLKDKLCQELPGILNWVLCCLRELLRQKAFTESPVCNKALEEYKLNCNSALRFMEEGYVVSNEGRYTLKELYAEYLTFCHEENITNRYGRNNFMQQIQTIGVEKHKSNGLCYLNVMKKAE